MTAVGEREECSEAEPRSRQQSREDGTNAMSEQTGGGAGPQGRLSYEQARAELAAVVEQLEAGGTTLEESLALWERGERLAEICQAWLDGARERLEVARQPREAE
jgi:exodeoxyribonuclease VII small subunit